MEINSKPLQSFVLQSHARRRRRNLQMCLLLGLAALIVLVPLFCVFGYALSHGARALSLQFFTNLPAPVGESGGGMANALVGTVTLVGLAALIGIPWGVAAGLYLSEFGATRLGSMIRFCADMLASVPSIVIGLFAYALVVRPMGHFSAYAGGAALGLLMIPTVARTTEEILRMVPTHIRETGLALGLPRWKVILWIVLKGNLRALVKGFLLAIARAAGETAPLLFTSFNNQFWSDSLSKPTASLPVQIYTYAISPFEEWQAQAWAGALVLLLFVFVLNLMTRLALRRPKGNFE